MKLNEIVILFALLFGVGHTEGNTEGSVELPSASTQSCALELRSESAGDYHMENGDQGEFTVAITPRTKSNDALVEINGVETTKLEGVQTVRIYPNNYGRGFFIQRCKDKIGDLQFHFLGFDGDLISYEDDWIQDKQPDGCEVNRVRGVQYMEIKVNMIGAPLSQIAAGSIKLSQELWYMDTDFKIFFVFVSLFVLATQSYAMWRAKWFEDFCVNREDEFRTQRTLFMVESKDENEARQAPNANRNLAAGAGINGDSEEHSVDLDTTEQQQSEQQSSKFSVDFVDILCGKVDYRAVFNVALHIFDMVSDLLYFFCIPMFNTWFLVFFVISMMLPIIITASVVHYLMEGGSLRNKFMMTMLIILNIAHQIPSKKSQDVRDMLDRTRIIFLLEDAPQFYLQLFNSILIGSTWSWLQVFSPLLTTYFLISRFIKPQGIHGWNKTTAILIFIYLITVYLYIIFGVFYSTDARPEWAKVLPNVRIGYKFI